MRIIKKKIKDTVIYFEKKTQTDIRKITRGWSWLVLGKIAGSFTSIALAVAYSHYLDKSDYGTYKYILSVFALISIFCLQGMENASQRSVAKNFDGSYWTTFVARLKFGTLTVITSSCIGLYYLMAGNDLLGITFLLASPLILLSSTLTHYNSYLLGKQKFKQIGNINLLIQIVASICIILTVVHTQNVLLIIIVNLLSFSLLYGTVFLHVFKKYKFNTLEDPDALSYGKHLSAIYVMNIISNQATPLLLWHFLGPIEVAIYAFAQAVVNEIRGVLKLITNTIAFPKFANLETKFIQLTLPRKVMYAHCLTIPSAIVLALLIPEAYQLLFPKYTESVIYAQVMILLLGFTPMRLYSTALLAKGSAKAVYVANIINSFSPIILLCIFIPIFGIWGIIYTNIISQTISNSVVLHLFKKMK